MNKALIATLPFFAGCILYMGDESIPIVCSTRLPGTQYSVFLHGPDDGKYFYVIETDDGDCGCRELGAAVIGATTTPILTDLGNGVYRVTWGSRPGSPFAEVDTKHRLFVVDNNGLNPRNKPFETPRYLRPGYLKLSTGR